MYRCTKTQSVNDLDGARKESSWKVRFFIFLLGFLPVCTTLGQQPDKVQQAIDATKAANYNENDDYITDGQRVVWVKSYKNWTPEDFVIIKKERPGTLKFLGQAVQRQRFDVLEQLLPNYYRARGGVKAFAEDITRNQVASQNNIGKRKPS